VLGFDIDAPVYRPRAAAMIGYRGVVARQSISLCRDISGKIASNTTI
jgi:hypothetical protein